MQARAHLKLIVSEPQAEEPESTHERMSMVQPVSNLRLRLQWLRMNATAIALWSATALLLSVAGVLLVTRL